MGNNCLLIHAINLNAACNRIIIGEECRLAHKNIQQEMTWVKFFIPPWGGWLVGFVTLRPKSQAMVIAGRSVHLTTLFPGQA